MRLADTSGSPKVCPAASNHLTRSARALTFTFSDVAGVASWKSSTEASRSGRAIWPRRRTRSPGGACLIWPRGTTSRADLEQVADGRRRHAQRRQPCSSPDPAKLDARQLARPPAQSGFHLLLLPLPALQACSAAFRRRRDCKIVGAKFWYVLTFPGTAAAR